VARRTKCYQLLWFSSKGSRNYQPRRERVSSRIHIPN